MSELVFIVIPVRTDADPSQLLDWAIERADELSEEVSEPIEFDENNACVASEHGRLGRDIKRQLGISDD